MKPCPKCGAPRSTSNSSYCKSCLAVWARQRRKIKGAHIREVARLRRQNPQEKQKIKARNSFYYADHQSQALEYSREYRKQHPQQIAATHRRWQMANKVWLAAYRRSYPKYKDYISQWRAKNRERYREIKRSGWNRRRARELKAPGVHTIESWLARVQYFGWKCWICKRILNYATLTKDHVIALSVGGSDWASNLRPACLSCNSGKRERRIK